ncbi:nuclease/transposase family protein [Treponema sp. R8-4-B8]
MVKTELAAGKPVEEMTNAELWAVFFQYLTDEEKRAKIIEITNREEGIAMAVDTLINITKDEIEYARMTTLIKSELDWRSGMADAEDKGRKKASLDIARNLKGMGLSISQIAEGTGLSPETIAKL